MHGCIPCMCDTLSSRTAPKKSSSDHCMPRFAISSKLVLILGVNVKNRHSFFHRSAICHLCGTSALCILGRGATKIACAWEDDQKAYGIRVQAIVIDVGQSQCNCSSNLNPTPTPSPDADG